MKVKIKGLVFVGFAAAVFASSAMATISANENDKKIVASKYYVDSNFQDKSDRVTANPTGTEQEIANAWNSTTTYPSMAILKGVKDTLDAINVVEGSTGYVDVEESPTGTFTVDLVSGQVTSSVGASNTSSAKLVTEGAVANYAQDKSKFDDATYDSTNQTYTSTIGASSANDEYPSSRNVYEFVTNQGSAAYQPKTAVATGETNDTLKVGKGAGQWGNLEAITTNDQATGDYVTIKADTNGVYQINIAAAQIADSIATDSSAKLVTENAVYDLVDREETSGTSTIGSQSTTLVPTSKNVYDFVNNGYQPKTTTQGVMTGYNGTWHTLSGDSTYITVADSGSAASVTLGNMTGSTSDFVAAVASNDANYDTVSATRGKLALSGDVYDFVTAQLGGLAIPEMPDGCETAAAAGGYCALVYGDTGTGTAQNPVYGLQWTVMAQPTGN